MTLFLGGFFGFVRRRPIFTASLLVAAVLGAANYPLWQARLEAARQHETARRNGEFMLHALSNRSQIEADLTALRGALGQIEQHLVDDRSMEVNLGYFYRLERTTGVRLVRLNQLVSLPTASGSPFKSVPFSMQMTGSYRNSMNFLRALETGPRIVRVRSCSFERGAGESAELLLDLTVDVLAKI